MASCLGGLQSRRFRRVATILASLFLAIGTIVFLVDSFALGGVSLPAKVSGHKSSDTATSRSNLPLCTTVQNNGTWQPEKWKAAEAKYSSLLDDKFTYVPETVGLLAYLPSVFLLKSSKLITPQL